MILTFCSVLLLFLFIYPFMPGIRELHNREDADPLYIEMDYTQNPRYFADSFRKILVNSLKTGGATEGVYQLNLSKSETVEILANVDIEEDTSPPNILCVKGDLHSEKSVVFRKEVYVHGAADIGKGNLLRSLACNSNVHLHSGTKFCRWLDAKNNIQAEPQCFLGLSASCGGTLTIARLCSFKRLYGFPIITGKTGNAHTDNEAEPAFSQVATALSQFKPKETSEENFPLNNFLTERNLSEIPPFTRKNCNIISSKTLHIGEHCVINGDIKSKEDLIVDANVMINGNVFAEGNICIGKNSRILGTMFTQENLCLKNGVTVGNQEKIKSVIARKGITFMNRVTIYGYVMTEGTGIVL